MQTMDMTKSGTISEAVDAIIKQRKEKSPVLRRKKQELQQILEMLDAFDALKWEIIDKEGNPLPGKYQHVVDQNPEMPDKLLGISTEVCRSQIKKAMEECDAAINRFDRDRINISVVGMAGTGKSFLLQRITNLDDYVIPSADGTDCTGAVSVIENYPDMDADAVEATITFKTQEQMVNIVQEFLDVMIEDPAKKLHIYTMQQIRNLKMEDIESRMNKHSAHNSKKKHLRKYIEQYAVWAPLVLAGETLKRTDKKEIQEFVAQHNGEEKGSASYKEYFKYLAVDSCHIRCRFNYQEAGKITLLDTVGIGDTAVGIEDDMIEVVTKKSDAVIFINKPHGERGGGFPQQICDVYELIEKNCRNRNLDQWLSWMINRDKRPEEGNSEAAVKTALTTLHEMNFAGKLKRIVDISDEEEVRDMFLIPLLRQLGGNLQEIDKLFTDDLQKSLNDVRRSYNSICNQAGKVMESKLGSTVAMKSQTDQQIDHMRESVLSGRLRALANAEKEKRDIPCDILQERVDELLNDMRGGMMIPDPKQLQLELQGKQTPVVYINTINNLRNAVVQRFSDVDSSLGTLVVEAKNSLTDILYSEDGCRLGRVLKAEPEAPLYEWLGEFAEKFLDPSVFPNLHTAFMKVHDFDFSVNGFMTYEVRACLDEIDPDLSVVPSLSGETLVKTSRNMYEDLVIRLNHVVDGLEENLNILFEKPHRAFFAMIKEFTDKVLYAEKVKYEWNSLFSEHYKSLWREEFKALSIATAAFADWTALLEKMLELNSQAGTLEKIG